MFLSILIPVFDGRIHLLDLTLQSIKRQNVSISYEIIILNDGTRNNGSEDLATKYGCKYIFTGQRNTEEKIYWRTAAFSFNIGIRQAKGDLIILQEPEVYHFDNNHINKLIMPHLEKINNIATHPKRVYIDTGVLLDKIEKQEVLNDDVLQQVVNNYHSYFWYSLCLKKETLLNVNGIDEAFLGQCFDDGQFFDVLVNSGVKFIPTDSDCIHLFHPRQHTPHWQYNKDLYDLLKNNTKNNLSKPNWGQNDWVNIWGESGV